MKSLAKAAVLIAVVSATAHAQAAKPAAPFSPADVDFMSDMIHHHAQAVAMCDMADTHQASAPVRALCKRTLVSQRDEIEIMSTWLRKRNQEVPQAEGHHHSAMEELEHSSMPGMASPVLLRQLDNASGVAWDRLLLQTMIKHHEGALVMVKKLSETSGAGQSADVFSIASGIEADQRAEIARMQGMLAAIPPAK